MEVIHHGAVNGVTGSCHELIIDQNCSVLIDCGLFQGTESSQNDASSIGFPTHRINALIVTHCHIDHVGRIPNLIAEGFRGKIYCSEATAVLLPLILEDAMKMGITKNKRLIKQFLAYIHTKLIPLPYGKWQPILFSEKSPSLQIKLKPAGHILGSAYVECKIAHQGNSEKVIFSGDLGAPYTPLLPAPKSPWSADLVVLESTYGDRLHESRKQRHLKLKQLVEKAFENRGVILIPAFSIGRTQELVYELEELIHQFQNRQISKGLDWGDIEIILDSPLAAKFTEAYEQLRPYWDKEAKSKLSSGRHPLSFSQLTTIDDHQTHNKIVSYLKQTTHPRIVIAGSGMCTGGRIVNYLKALLSNPLTDVLFVGYQADGTPGRDIQRYGPAKGYVHLDSQRVDIQAGVHTIGGYSAHADQRNLINFVTRMRRKPKAIKLVHGSIGAKQALKAELDKALPGCLVTIAT